MDLDLEFSAAERRLQREREARKRSAAREQRRQAQIKHEAAVAAARVEALALARRRERIAAQEFENAANASGSDSAIKCESVLTLRPLARAATNRVGLPASILSSLEGQGWRERVSGPLTFEVSVDVPRVGRVRTFCGVEDFTEPEGSIGVPPGVALSLAGGEDVTVLQGAKASVRFVELPHFKEVKVALQPRGSGFHKNDEEEVQMDLKTVLMRSLRDMLTISEGEVVPVRHEGVTYELVVKKVEPEPALVIIDTDVEVEILPSERAEEELKKREDRARWLQERHERIEEKRRTNVEGEEDKEKKKLPIRVRMPQGQTFTRSFMAEDTFRKVLDWVEVNLPEPPADLPMHAGDNMEFFLVQVLAGQRSRYDASMADKTLHEVGFRGRESLLVNWNYYPDGEMPSEQDPCDGQSLRVPLAASVEPPVHQDDLESQTPKDSEETGLEGDQKDQAKNYNTNTGEESHTFVGAMQAAEAKFDRSLEEEQLRKALEESAALANGDQEQVDKVHVFHSLVAKGVPHQQAAQGAQKFASQFVELETMGFGDHLRNLELLERYQGRLERVVNLLAGGD